MIVSNVLRVCSDFVSQINSTLNSLPSSSGATHHRLEIVQRTKAAFFVVCSKSPRFIWSRSLTQQDVGRNLDFCGPGHFTRAKWDPLREALLQVYEVHDSATFQITNECVFVDESADTSTIDTIFQKRTDLWNSTMKQLELPYRFDGVWYRGNFNRSEIRSIMEAETPPSADWWAQNYPRICFSPFSSTYFSASTQFDTHWLLLRSVYEITSSYEGKYARAMQCSEDTEKIFRSLHHLFVSTAIQSDTLDSLEMFNDFSNLNVQKRIVSQVESIELFRPDPDDPFPDGYGTCIESSGLKRLLQTFVELIRMYTVERWKLNQPLMYNYDFGVEGWYDYGHGFWCTDPLRTFKFKLLFSRWFWFDKGEM